MFISPAIMTDLYDVIRASKSVNDSKFFGDGGRARAVHNNNNNHRVIPIGFPKYRDIGIGIGFFLYFP